MDIDTNSRRAVDFASSVLLRLHDVIDYVLELVGRGEADGGDTKAKTTLLALVCAAMIPVAIAGALRSRKGGEGERRWNPPPRLPERVPYVGNAVSFMTDMKGLFDHAG